MGLFRKKSRKNVFFPEGREGRLETIMSVHRKVSGSDELRSSSTLDLLLDLIEGERDVFLVDSYVLYYIGYYKPFVVGNEETAKAMADGILSDNGWSIPQSDKVMGYLKAVCNNAYCIDTIAEWQKANAVKC